MKKTSMIAVVIAGLFLSGCTSPYPNDRETLEPLSQSDEAKLFTPKPAPVVEEASPFEPVAPTEQVFAEPEAEQPSFSTSGSQILDPQGNPFIIKAISWFGMETELCTPHGLWQVRLEDAVATMKSAGFNTIRLPYSNDCLKAQQVSSVDANPDYAGLYPIEMMDVVINEADKNGMYVILDQHRPNKYAQSDFWYADDLTEEQWIEDWKMLAERYKTSLNVIGADLHNEPAGEACWGCNDATKDWASAAERAGNAIHSVNDDWLIIVEGVMKSNHGEYTWMGGGLWHVKERPITLKVPQKVIYSPHTYPASVYVQPWFEEQGYPGNMSDSWSRKWGYIAQENIAPIFVGEFGTKYQTDDDKIWLNSLVKYIDDNDMSFGYWSYNPNSDDTGGIVKDDWVTLESEKLQALAPILN